MRKTMINVQMISGNEVTTLGQVSDPLEALKMALESMPKMSEGDNIFLPLTLSGDGTGHLPALFQPKSVDEDPA
jgi:hypothetical protein